MKSSPINTDPAAAAAAAAVTDSKPPPRKPEFDDVTDENKVVYALGKYLGGGVEGGVFEARVVDSGNNPYLQEGEIVAIKQQIIDDDNREAVEREAAILSKKGDLFGSTTIKKDGMEYRYLVMDFVKAEELRRILYNISDDPRAKITKDDKNNNLPQQDKEKISNELLSQYFSLQLLGIRHCDIKPDNILYGKDGITVIDFGNSFDAETDFRPDYFIDGGYIYGAPEGQDPSTNPENLSHTDGYSVGIMLASIWSKSCYEGDAPKQKAGQNDALVARTALDDILNPALTTPPDGMPEHLFRTIRHLTQVDPSKRPETIALADGIRDVPLNTLPPELKLIRYAQDQVDNLRKEVRQESPKAISHLITENKDKAVYDKTANAKKALAHMSELTGQLKSASSDEEKAIIASLCLSQLEEHSKSKQLPEDVQQKFKGIYEELTEKLALLKSVPEPKKSEAKVAFTLSAMEQISRYRMPLTSRFATLQSKIDEILSSPDPSSIIVELRKLKGKVGESKDYRKEKVEISAYLDSITQNFERTRTKEAQILFNREMPWEEIKKDLKDIANASIPTMQKSSATIPTDGGLYFAGAPPDEMSATAEKLLKYAQSMASRPGFPDNMNPSRKTEVLQKLQLVLRTLEEMPSGQQNDKIRRLSSELRVMLDKFERPSVSLSAAAPAAIAASAERKEKRKSWRLSTQVPKRERETADTLNAAAAALAPSRSSMPSRSSTPSASSSFGGTPQSTASTAASPVLSSPVVKQRRPDPDAIATLAENLDALRSSRTGVSTGGDASRASGGSPASVSRPRSPPPIAPASRQARRGTAGDASKPSASGSPSDAVTSSSSDTHPPAPLTSMYNAARSASLTPNSSSPDPDTIPPSPDHIPPKPGKF